jgi:hypothetical protein
MFRFWQWLCSIWKRVRLAWELARLTKENRRLTKELRLVYGKEPIPLTRAEIERLRELRKGIPAQRIKELGGLDLDRDVIQIDE